MTKPYPEQQPDPSASPSRSWGTGDELLLAFAVDRHGTSAWDSIASELQKRTSFAGLRLTAQNCRLKYLDLKRRYVASDEERKDFGENEDDDGKSDTVPLLEELRKLRLAELRREVQRYDLNIESLELKIKRMEEQGDKNLTKGEAKRSDLEKDVAAEREPEPPPAEPVTVAELEELSVNESNSTDPLADKSRIDEKESKPDPAGGDDVSNDRTGRQPDEPIQPDSAEAVQRKSVREDSCNGSSNSIGNNQTKAGPVSRSAAVVESPGVSGNGGGEDEAATKETSDVQSSASKSRKEMGKDKVLRESTSGDEREHEDQSRAVKDFSAQSQPLMDFLLGIRSRRLCSFFERRLISQNSAIYKKMILQHIDLEIIEARLKEGYYSSSADKFFRDLLLLVNNALVFYPRSSPEANAATEIRGVVSKEISHRNSKSDSSTGKQVSLQSSSVPKKEEAEPSNSITLKPRISGPLIVCRKRSSITAKATGAVDKKREHRVSLLAEAMEEEKRKPEEEPKISKKRRRERFSSISVNSNQDGKTQDVTTSNNSSLDSGKQQGKVGGSSSHHEEQNKLSQSQAVESKKRGAAMFLNRMNQSSSPTNNGVLLDALKYTPLTSDSTGSKGGSESKKNKNTKQQRGVEKKETSTRKSSETRQAKEKAASPVKRTVGRPPKRAAPAPPPPSLGKRGREKTETEPTSSSKQPKKRSRKL